MKILMTAGVVISLFSISPVYAESKAKTEVKEAAAKTESAAKATAEDVKAKKEEVKKEAAKEEVTKVEEAIPEPTEYGKPKGLLGPITLGPQVSGGLPTLIRFGIEGKLFNFLGFGLEYGFVPTVTLSSVALNLNAFSGNVKVFPWKSSFFLGAALGSRNFSGTIPTTVSGTTVTLTGSANTFFITPMLGWRWVKPSGFFFGMDFGWQFALSASSSITSNPAALAATAASTTEFTSLSNTLRDIGRASLPSLTLLQFGWLF